MTTGSTLCETGKQLLDSQNRAYQHGEETGKYLLYYHNHRDYKEHIDSCESCIDVSL